MSSKNRTHQQRQAPSAPGKAGRRFEAVALSVPASGVPTILGITEFPTAEETFDWLNSMARMWHEQGKSENEANEGEWKLDEDSVEVVNGDSVLPRKIDAKHLILSANDCEEEFVGGFRAI